MQNRKIPLSETFAPNLKNCTLWLVCFFTIILLPCHNGVAKYNAQKPVPQCDFSMSAYSQPFHDKTLARSEHKNCRYQLLQKG